MLKRHILPITTICVDPGTEDSYFKTQDAIIDLNEIPGAIHVDHSDHTKHTQTVERSHSSIKMRLRLGRDLHRHNLQSVPDLEDFVYNRTNRLPANIFKVLGDAAKTYVRTIDNITTRMSNLPILLPDDDVEHIPVLCLHVIKELRSTSVSTKCKRFEDRNSTIFATQSTAELSPIDGQYHSTRILDQSITWRSTPVTNRFDISRIRVYCSCKFSLKATSATGMCCTQLIGHLRRTIYLARIQSS